VQYIGLGSVPYGALVPVGFSNVLACYAELKKRLEKQNHYFAG